jgi:hypothetical protein
VPPSPAPDRSPAADVRPARDEATPVPASTPGAREEDTPLVDRVRALELRMSKGQIPARVRSLDQLSKRLELTKTQEDRIAAVIENGRRSVEEILKVPDGSGTSPYVRRQELRGKVREAVRTGQWQEVIDAMRMPRVRRQTIPGRNTTYGEEIARIVDETRAEIVRNLDRDQQQEFGNTEVDPMLTPGGVDPGEVIAWAKKEGLEPG